MPNNNLDFSRYTLVINEGDMKKFVFMNDPSYAHPKSPPEPRLSLGSVLNFTSSGEEENWPLQPY